MDGRGEEDARTCMVSAVGPTRGQRFQSDGYCRIAPEQDQEGEQTAMQEKRTEADMRHFPDQPRACRHDGTTGAVGDEPSERHVRPEPPKELRRRLPAPPRP